MAEELTENQKLKQAEWEARANACAFATGPSDRPVCIENLPTLCKALLRPFPGVDKVIFAQSPFQAKRLMNYLKHDDKNHEVLNTHTQENNDSWVLDVVAKKNALKDIQGSNWKNENFDGNLFSQGSIESYWTYYNKFYNEEMDTVFVSTDKEFLEKFAPVGESLGCETKMVPQKVLEIYYVFSQASGYIYIFDEFIIVCDRASSIVREANRLHNLNGPALAYSDGIKIYSIGGVTVPEKVVMCPETLTMDEINGETNQEVKRLMIERYGAGEYLKAVGAQVIDTDSAGFDNSAPRYLLATKDMKWLVGSDGSTNRVYYMNVPMEAKTCKEAHEMISGLSEKNCIAEG